jgi:hypothetical protein
LFLPALACIVLANWRWNAIVNDTLLLFSSFGLRLDTIPNMIGRVLFGPGMHVAFFYFFSGILLAYAVAAMARAVGLRWGVAVLAGILLPLLILPTFGQFPLVEQATC